MEELKKNNIKKNIYQKFILGFKGTKPDENIKTAIKSGLGGVILFSENIESYEQAASLTAELQSLANIPLFISIDQEGGKIERTKNVKNKINYLSPAELSSTKDPEKGKLQAEIMIQELKSIGVNMNFAPVLDVNTNCNNPIICDRSFGCDSETVIKYARPVYQTFLKSGIIPVVKHFPGHGDTCEDSHHTMPVVDLKHKELENIHIKPFKTAIEDDIEAIMTAHAHYTAFDKGALPASLSKNIITNHLRNKLGFKGLVISDDMVMGGIKKYYEPVEACLMGIKAGIDIFIFRDSDTEILSIIDKLVEYTENGVLSKVQIDDSARRILACKVTNGFIKT